MTQKIVINRCVGGFGLSPRAYKELGLEWDGYGYAYRSHHSRDDQDLVSVVEKLGKEASGGPANLVVVEIPDEVEWEIDEYNGLETVEEKHRSWP